jgi:hypothetical protein
MHNHIRHSLDMPSSENGFRAWTDDRPPLGFKRYGCGWSGLPHYSVRAEIEVAAMIHPLGWVDPSAAPGSDGIRFSFG